MSTRRALLRALAAGALAAPLSRAADARARSAQRRGGSSEVATLKLLILREDAAAEAYATAARRTGDPLLARLRDHDRLHGAALRTEIEALTVKVGPPRSGRAVHDRDAAPLAAASRPATAHAAAIALEEALVAVYAGAIGGLVDAGLLQTATSVMAAHAQRLVALRLAVGQRPLDPQAGVAGSP